MKVNTEKAFAKAVASGAKEIEVEGPLAEKVEAVIKVSTVKWGLLVGGLGVGVGLAPFSGGVSMGVAVLPLAIASLGLGVVASSAIGVLLSIGGVSLLDKTRKYRIGERKNGSIVLRWRE